MWNAKCFIKKYWIFNGRKRWAHATYVCVLCVSNSECIFNKFAFESELCLYTKKYSIYASFPAVDNFHYSNTHTRTNIVGFSINILWSAIYLHFVWITELFCATSVTRFSVYPVMFSTFPASHSQLTELNWLNMVAASLRDLSVNIW